MMLRRRRGEGISRWHARPTTCLRVTTTAAWRVQDRHRSRCQRSSNSRPMLSSPSIKALRSCHDRQRLIGLSRPTWETCQRTQKFSLSVGAGRVAKLWRLSQRLAMRWSARRVQGSGHATAPPLRQPCRYRTPQCRLRHFVIVGPAHCALERSESGQFTTAGFTATRMLTYHRFTLGRQLAVDQSAEVFKDRAPTHDLVRRMPHSSACLCNFRMSLERARAMRDRTVPTGLSVMSAISA